MAKILFISVQTLKSKSVIMDNTDEKTLTIAIQEFQELELEGVLGKTEYDRLSNELVKVQQGTQTDLTPSDRTLMDHIIPMVVYGSLMYSISPLHQKISNKGVQVDRDINSEQGNLGTARADYAFKMDGYKGKLIKYINDTNTTTTKCCESSQDTTFNFTGVSLPDNDFNYESQYRSDYYKDYKARRII